MTTPEDHAGLAAALAAVQAELPEVKKTRTAKVEKDGRLLYTYDYADLADVSLAILPLLGKHGLAFMAVPGHQENGKFGLRYYLLHSSGAQIEGFYEIAEQGGMQMVGGRITYARRYCLCAVTGIAAEDDVDAREEGNSNGRRAQRQQPTGGSGEQQQSQGTAQRRNPNPPRTPARQRPAASVGGDPPPLPGEEEDPTTSGASSSAHAPDSGSPQETGGQSPSSSSGSDRSPDETDYDTPGTVGNRQLTAIWTTLTRNFSFGNDDGEKEEARIACGIIIGRDLDSTKNLSHNDARKILDTLGNVHHQAQEGGGDPRNYLTDLLKRTEEARAEAGGSE